ncbi:MAG TPA: ABC transporter substrate binding protein, partial [Syntrophobacteria bacterium]|nr:ABC transporter substrate binding protein [Syntrophobacteria bacterium]
AFGRLRLEAGAAWVMAASAHPAAQGLVSSLAHPGGNVTGLSALYPAASRNRLRLLAEVVPRLTHVGVLRMR